MKKINFVAYNREFKRYIDFGFVSEKLGELFKYHIDIVASSDNFKFYLYHDAMKEKALSFLIKYSNCFKSENGHTVFHFCSQIIFRAFLQVIEKKNRNLTKSQRIKQQELLATIKVEADNTSPGLSWGELGRLIGKMTPEQKKHTVEITESGHDTFGKSLAFKRGIPYIKGY